MKQIGTYFTNFMIWMSHDKKNMNKYRSINNAKKDYTGWHVKYFFVMYSPLIYEELFLWSMIIYNTQVICNEI